MVRYLLSLSVVFSLGFLVSCSQNTITQTETKTNNNIPNNSSDNDKNLALVANGENLVRQGFITKDGWQVNFNHVYINLANVTAFESNPPFNAENKEKIKAEKQVILLNSSKTVDLAQGNENASAILVNKVNAEPGLYNALKWNIINGTEGVTQNQSIVINGIAKKDSQLINFVLNFNPELSYQCGEFIGEERKGILTANNSAELEVTLHFDHIFGSQKLAINDELNVGAIGFSPLAKLAQNNSLNITLDELSNKLSREDYQKLTAAINSLGHVGEGHCYESKS